MKLNAINPETVGDLKPKSLGLTPEQLRIYNILLSDPNAFIIPSKYYHFQELHYFVEQKKYFQRSTFDSLLKKGIIATADGERYKLKENLNKEVYSSCSFTGCPNPAEWYIGTWQCCDKCAEKWVTPSSSAPGHFFSQWGTSYRSGQKNILAHDLKNNNPYKLVVKDLNHGN